MQQLATIRSIMADVRALGVPEAVVNVIEQIICANARSDTAQEAPKVVNRPASLPEAARLFHRLSMSKAQLLGADLVFDPAWHMLLTLFDEHARGRETSVSSLCYASGSPFTTSLRVLSALEKKRMIRKRPDSRDGRRIFIEPEVETIARVGQALERLCAGQPITPPDCLATAP